MSSGSSGGSIPAPWSARVSLFAAGMLAPKFHLISRNAWTLGHMYLRREMIGSHTQQIVIAVHQAMACERAGRACRGRERASKRASSAASVSAGSPSRRPRPGISTGQTCIQAGSSVAHLQRAGPIWRAGKHLQCTRIEHTPRQT